MFLIILLCVFTSQIFLVRSQSDSVKIYMNISVNDENRSVCEVQEKYVLKEGILVQFIINTNDYINHAWRSFENRHNSSLRSDIKITTDGVMKSVTVEEFQITPYYDGLWRFKIYSHKNSEIQTIETYADNNYTATYCIIDISVTAFSGVSWKNMTDTQKYLLFGGGLAFLIIFMVLVQTCIIVYYRSKAKAAKVHQNLSKRRKSNDIVRYSVGNPRKAQSRDSILYETLEEVNLQRTEAPEPPAIETLPKNPGSRSALRTIDKKNMLSSVAMSSSSAHLLPEAGFSDETLRLKERPQLPLPMEEYEEIGREADYQPPPEFLKPEEENTYEPPPEFEARKARGKFGTKKPMPLPVNQRNLQQNTSKPSHKPENTIPKSVPKPKPGINPMAAELSNVLNRRNTGLSTLNPIKPLSSSASSTSNSSLPKKPKATLPVSKTSSDASTNSLFKKKQLTPPPAPVSAKACQNKALPATPRLIPPPTNKKALPPAPIPQFNPPAHPIQVSTYNDEPNSSDEEWTYEPLKEIKLNKPPPRHNDTEAPSCGDGNTSDEEWTYEPIQPMNIYNNI